jgi:hypothetical protein
MNNTLNTRRCDTQFEQPLSPGIKDTNPICLKQPKNQMNNTLNTRRCDTQFEQPLSPGIKDTSPICLKQPNLPYL